MKRCRVVFLNAFFLFTGSVSFAQTPSHGVAVAKDDAIFCFPKNGDLYVPTRTTLALRMPVSLMAIHSAQDFLFTITGNQSGLHSGKVVIAADGRTVIFKPAIPFTLSEEVTVSMKIRGAEDFAPISYTFRITSMTDEIRDRSIADLIKLEQTPPTEPQEALTFPVADSLPIAYSIDAYNKPYPGNTYFTATNLFNGAYSFIGILDALGKPAFYRNVPIGCENFKMLSDTTFTYFKQTAYAKTGIGVGVIERMDINGKIFKEYRCGNGYTTDYHDFQLLPNGHALLVSFDPEYVDMTKVIPDPGARTNAIVTGAIIQEIDQDTNVVFQWRSWDHLQITDATEENLTVPTIDYVHMNTALIDTDGNIIASFRHQDAVYKISRNDGSTIWVWGGKHNQFQFLGDTLKFSHQHNPLRIPNGHITLWDNGNYRLKDTLINSVDTVINSPYSRAVEFDLDEVHHTATSVWEYRNVPFSSAGGNVQRFPDGSTLIGLGISSSPAVIEINPRSETTFKCSLQPGTWCYRAYKFPVMLNTTFSGVKNDAVNTLRIESIYPNPVQNTSRISFISPASGRAQIELTDVLGHTIRSQYQNIDNAGMNENTIEADGLSNGTYYVRISQNGRSATTMIVVQK